jgi:6-methylsalicylate decarboxylase
MSLIVDLHHHAMPDFYWHASNEDGKATGGITPPHWSAAGDLAYLDEAGIDLAVLSISAPGVHFGDDAAARTLARRSNEYLADLVRDRPDRYAALAAIPLPDLDGAITELDHTLSTLELDGVALMSNAGGRYLGDSQFDELFAELQRRAATVFVHPTVSPFSRTRRPSCPAASSLSPYTLPITPVPNSSDLGRHRERTDACGTPRLGAAGLSG